MKVYCLDTRFLSIRAHTNAVKTCMDNTSFVCVYMCETSHALHAYTHTSGVNSFRAQKRRRNLGVSARWRTCEYIHAYIHATYIHQVKSLFALKSADVILVQAQDGGRQVCTYVCGCEYMYVCMWERFCPESKDNLLNFRLWKIHWLNHVFEKSHTYIHTYKGHIHTHIHIYLHIYIQVDMLTTDYSLRLKGHIYKYIYTYTHISTYRWTCSPPITPSGSRGTPIHSSKRQRASLLCLRCLHP